MVKCERVDKESTASLTPQTVQGLRKSLSLMIAENNNITDFIENKYKGNPGAEPYFRFSQSLNHFINSSVDTTFSNLGEDSTSVKLKLTALDKRYHQIIDSISIPYKFPLFLTNDDSLLKSRIFEYPGYFNDPVINRYIITQRILQRHFIVLKIMRGCIGEIY